MGGGSFSRNGKGGKNTSVIFSLKDGVGALAEALKVFKVSTGCPNKFWMESFNQKRAKLEFEIFPSKKFVKLKRDLYCLARR